MLAKSHADTGQYLVVQTKLSDRHLDQEVVQSACAAAMLVVY